MGGLVGGAYATGMTPAELASMMKATDWDLMFLSDSPFKYKTFRRKQDKRAYPSQIEFGLKDGFNMPEGLNPGQQVALMLDRIALPYSDIDSFDDLPTPFRCVATDLKTAEIVVLSKGRLALAMRATMSLPAVFAPVSYDDWLLVDGGTLNNIPADVDARDGRRRRDRRGRERRNRRREGGQADPLHHDRQDDLDDDGRRDEAGARLGRLRRRSRPDRPQLDVVAGERGTGQARVRRRAEDGRHAARSTR